MHHILGTLLIGAIAGGVANNSNRRRPFVRRLVKGGIAAKRKIEGIGAKAVAETRKIVEEARADLDQPGTEMHN